MKRLIVLFEDHSAQQLRPLSWSVPVHEIPCGLFNLRERLDQVRAALGLAAEPAFLIRSLLTGLQSAGRPAAPVGAQAVAAALASADEAVFLSSRLSLDTAGLCALLQDLPLERPLGDDAGLLAWCLPGPAAAATVIDWAAWEAAAASDGAWTRDGIAASPWRPVAWASEPLLPAWRHLWELVPRIGPCIVQDLDFLRRGEAVHVPERTVFGALLAGGGPVRLPGSVLSHCDPRSFSGVHVVGEGPVWADEDVVLAPGTVLDVSHGPVVLESGVRVMPHAYLEGPLQLGAGVRVKAGAQLYGETAVGAMSRVNGEIAESQICAYANKQHAGFLGHAVLGSWTNLGAGTTNSDLKNNYGEISVNYGLGAVETGSRFVGLMMAEHAKTAIGTLFNTGTTVGFSSNVFGAGFPRSCLRNYTWGDGRGRRLYQAERAVEVAAIVMSRRGCAFTASHDALFRALSDEGA